MRSTSTDKKVKKRKSNHNEWSKKKHKINAQGQRESEFQLNELKFTIGKVKLHLTSGKGVVNKNKHLI